MGVGWCGMAGERSWASWGGSCSLLGVVGRGRGGMVGPAPPPMMLSMLKLTLGLGDMARAGPGAGDMGARCGECGARPWYGELRSEGTLSVLSRCSLDILLCLALGDPGSKSLWSRISRFLGDTKPPSLSSRIPR